jgi:hypothetical protein
MRKTITILATVLAASVLIGSEAEAYGGGGFNGQASRSSRNMLIGGYGSFGQVRQDAPRSLKSYPDDLPYGSCFSLWYTIPGYRSPMDCSPGA